MQKSVDTVLASSFWVLGSMYQLGIERCLEVKSAYVSYIVLEYFCASDAVGKF
jgi:hypothetical protein